MLNSKEGEYDIRQETPTGEVYYVNKTTGEKIIKGTRRPDGSMRKEIKVRPGYTPREEQGIYIPKGKQKAKEFHEKPLIPGWDDSLISTNNKKKQGNNGKKKGTKQEELFSLIEGIEAVKISKEENKNIKVKSNNQYRKASSTNISKSKQVLNNTNRM